jgi:hypothetical protein
MTKDEIVAVTEYAESFLRSGGTVTFSEWQAMDKPLKAALVRASNALRTEMATMVGMAMTEEGRLKMTKKLDGGLSFVRHHLVHAIHQYKATADRENARIKL